MSELSVVAQRKIMATIRSRNGILYLDYCYESKRIQRSTGFKDTKANRKMLEKEIIPELMKKIYLGDLKKPESKRFNYYYEKFLKLHVDDKSYHNRVRVYNKVNEFFGNMYVSKITVLNVKEYLASLNLRNSSKKDYLGCIRGTLDIAIDDEEIDRNVAVNIRFKREAKAPIKPFSTDEITLMLDKSDNMFRNYIAISSYTGLRSGEVLGLMHSDILEDRICVRRSVSKGRVTSPKTLGSVRDIPMLEALRPYIENQKELSEFVKEIESISAISSHHSDTVKQSGQVINREVYVYNDCSYPWNGIFIQSIIRMTRIKYGLIK